MWELDNQVRRVDDLTKSLIRNKFAQFRAALEIE
jgi:hypothetical protein